MVQVLFVCLGNICRSPAAEGMMNKLIKDNNLGNDIQCDSAGTTGYHSGHTADDRMREAAVSRNVEIFSRARQIIYKDLDRFNYIITMDDENYRDVIDLDRDSEFRDKIFGLKEFCKDHSIKGVPDPYYGSTSGFHRVLDILEDGCQGLLEKIKKDNSIS